MHLSFLLFLMVFIIISNIEKTKRQDIIRCPYHLFGKLFHYLQIHRIGFLNPNYAVAGTSNASILGALGCIAKT